MEQLFLEINAFRGKQAGRQAYNVARSSRCFTLAVCNDDDGCVFHKSLYSCSVQVMCIAYYIIGQIHGGAVDCESKNALESFLRAVYHIILECVDIRKENYAFHRKWVSRFASGQTTAQRHKLAHLVRSLEQLLLL